MPNRYLRTWRAQNTPPLNHSIQQWSARRGTLAAWCCPSASTTWCSSTSLCRQDFPIRRILRSSAGGKCPSLLSVHPQRASSLWLYWTARGTCSELRQPWGPLLTRMSSRAAPGRSTLAPAAAPRMQSCPWMCSFSSGTCHSHTNACTGD